MGSKIEGKVEIPSDMFYPNGLDGLVAIEGLEHAALHVRILPAGPSTAGTVARGMPPPQAHGHKPPAAQHHEQPAHHEPPPVHAEGPPQKLSVSIVEAQGLHHLMHFTGDAPFCVCEVRHAEKKAKATKCETKPGKGQDPVWNETHEIDPWRVGEPLVFTVYEKGLMGSKVEGKVEIPSDMFYPQGLEGLVAIEGLEHAALHIQILPAGPSAAPAAPHGAAAHGAAAHASAAHGAAAHDAAAHSAAAHQAAQHHEAAPAPPPVVAEGPPQKLRVAIIGAQGLHHLMHFTGDAPFVKCEVRHAEKKHKATTCETKA